MSTKAAVQDFDICEKCGLVIEEEGQECVAVESGVCEA